MKPATLLSIGLLAVLSLGAAPRSPRVKPSYYFHREDVLGTSFELKVLAPAASDAHTAEAAALREIDRQAGILSAYDPHSEFSRWFRTRGRAVPVSPELFEVLRLFDQWRERTGGALDASAEVVVRAWKSAAAQNRLPTREELALAVRAVRQPHWRLDPQTRTATHLDDTPLVLNSFAKSYIIDHAAGAAMAAPRVSAVVVNIGGDLVVRGAWTEPVHLADPLSDAENSAPIARLMLRDRAIATSGNYRRGVEIGGRHYSHIVDPRTGETAERILSSTVIARNPAEAGALATAFSVLTPEQSRRLASSLPGVDFLIVARDGSHIASAGWQAFEVAEAQTASTGYAARQASPGAWDPEFELIVNLELSRPGGGRVRRPYVAVWIEDKEGHPVRTLALWYQKPRWLPELRAWYGADRLRAAAGAPDVNASITSATRPPGKYTLKWDGKDSSGNFVKAGAYTVVIEAAREHGTYQIIRQEMEFTGTPKQLQLPGNVEIQYASLDYRKSGGR